MDIENFWRLTMIDFKMLNKKDLALAIVGAVLILAAVGLDIAIGVKVAEEWRLVLSAGITNAAAVGLIFFVRDKLK
jgi:uncharacterized membrane protein